MSDTVLICDDSVAVHRSLKSYLKNSGIAVISSFTGEDALNTLQNMKIDLVVLDIMLPDMDGLDVCRKIRKSDDKVFVMMLSAKGEVLDRVVGLELGADDYVPKPFSPREVSLKIKRILSRMHTKSGETDKTITFDGIDINPESFQISNGSQIVDLTNKEMGVLLSLITNTGRAVTREQIIENVWGYDYIGDVRTVDSLMRRLKHKLKEAGISLNIKSIYGVGFRLDHDNEEK